MAACITPGSDLLLEDVYVGRGRAGFVEVLLRMGARQELLNQDRVRRTADVHVMHGPLTATSVGGGEARPSSTRPCYALRLARAGRAP